MNLLISLPRIAASCRFTSRTKPGYLYFGNLRERHSQVGSLAGAAHLLNNNTGVLRGAQRGQKSLVEQKGKSSFDFDFQYEYKL